LQPVTSNIDCPQKRRKEKESPRSCDKIGFTTKRINQEGNMGRVKSITPLVCAHSHFTYDERLQLEFYLTGTGKLPKITNLTMLGTLLHKHPRTIKREIARGLVEHVFDEGLQTKTVYNADYAENMARAKDSGKGPDLKLGRDYILAKEIGRLMKELHYSPYAVLAHFQNEGWPTDTRICEKTLYSYVYEGLIPDVSVKDLFLQGKSRKSPGGKKNHRNAALAAKSITTRPEEVSTRKDFGHWEGDTVVSGKGKGSECLLTMTERKTRTEISRKIPDRSAQSVVRALDILERELGSGDFRRLFRSITFDNGPEFQDIDGIEESSVSRKRRTTIFFAHPYCASERGSNERHNGIIRRFIPKGSAIGNYSKAEIREIQDWMNNYPRKILNGRTPAQMLCKEFPDRIMILRFFNIIPKEAA